MIRALSMRHITLSRIRMLFPSSLITSFTLPISYFAREVGWSPSRDSLDPNQYHGSSFAHSDTEHLPVHNHYLISHNRTLSVFPLFTTRGMVIPHNSGPWETSSHSHTSFDDVDFETHRYLTGKGDPRLPPILSDAPNGTHGQFNVRQRVNSLRSTQSIHGVQSIDPELMAVRRETEIQYKRAGATDKNDEALRLQKKARYSVEAERTEAGACHTKASTKMREAAIQKIAEAKRQKAEAQKRKMEAEKRKAEAQRNGEEARRREPEAYQKEQMAKRNEEAVRRRREEARRKEVDARRREDDARRRLDDAVRKEVLAREAETRLLEEVRTKEKERKSRPAQEKAMDHTLGIFRYECNEVTREADDATRLEATKADAAKRSAGFESAAPQRENWAHKERRWKQPEEREARFNHEPFVEQDWRREEKSHLDEKVSLDLEAFS